MIKLPHRITLTTIIITSIIQPPNAPKILGESVLNLKKLRNRRNYSTRRYGSLPRPHPLPRLRLIQARLCYGRKILLFLPSSPKSLTPHLPAANLNSLTLHQFPQLPPSGLQNYRNRSRRSGRQLQKLRIFGLPHLPQTQQRR